MAGFYLCLALLLAAVFGSFGNVLIHRLPRMILADDTADSSATHRTFNLNRPASHCPHCLVPLRGWHNIPLLSFLCLRGRCGHCHAPIARRYFVVEAGCVALAWLCVHRFGMTVDALAYFVFLYALWILSWIDALHYLLPDAITLPLLVAGLLFQFVFGHLPWTHALMAAALAYGLLRLVYHVHFALTRREGLGFGDMKLFAAIGAWLGLLALPQVLLLACVLAMLWLLIARLFREHSPLIPLGPFLSLAAMIELFYPQLLLRYLGL